MEYIMKAAACVCLWALACGAADAAAFHFGPCEGQMSEKGYGKTGNGTISAAVVIPKEQLAKYAGARVTGIRIGLVKADGFSNLRGWVRNSLNGADIAVADVASPHVGWNDVALDGGSVSGTDDIVVGYSFAQEVTARCMSVAGPVDSNGYWIAKNGEWTDKSGEKIGSLSIELVIEGDNVPAVNLGVTGTTFDKVTEFGKPYTAKVGVQNISNATVNGYSYKCSISGKTVAEGNIENKLEAFAHDTIDVSFASDAVAKGVRIPVAVEVFADGDGYAADNTATVYMSTYDEANTKYHHNVLLEEFSTEECGNCPRAINTIEQCMEQGFDKNVIQVTHHAGYKYDFLTTPDDVEMEWFYGSNGTFAPAAMLDRLSDEPCKEVLGGKPDSPVMSVGYANTFSPVLSYVTSRLAFVGVTPTCTYDAASRRIDITVDVEKDDVFDALGPAPRLFVYILQDSILHHHQAGYSSDTFKHRHVYRASVTPLFGEELAFSGNKAQKRYSYVLPEAVESSLFWEEEYEKNVPLEARDVEVVAFVGNYNPQDACDCTVFNTGRYSLKNDIPASVSSVESEKGIVAVEYLGIEGTGIKGNVANGIYLKHITYADGTRKTVKLIK